MEVEAMIKGGSNQGGSIEFGVVRNGIEALN